MFSRSRYRNWISFDADQYSIIKANALVLQKGKQAQGEEQLAISGGLGNLSILPFRTKLLYDLLTLPHEGEVCWAQDLTRGGVFVDLSIKL